MQRQLLIVGIDPGTTTGIAILTLFGEILSVNSVRELSFGTLIKETLNYGAVLAVGTDKKAVPHVVSRFATRTGAKVICPKNDLTREEKQALTKGCKVKAHEADALAAAFFAFDELKPILNKIKRFLEEEKKGYLFLDVAKLVVLKGIAIKKAIDLIEQPKSEIEKLVKKSKEGHFEKKKIPKQLPFILSYGKKERDELKKKIEIMNEFLANIGDKIIVKKLDNLKYNEILKKSYLNIKEGDILLVDDASISDKDAINFLKNKVSTIICKKKSNLELPFVTIDSKNLKISEIDDFAAIDKKELENLRASTFVLKKIIAEYKRERTN